MNTRKSLYTFVALVVGILLLLNVLSQKYFLRLDLTENKQYTLSQATTDIVKSLVEPVTVKAYFSENLPPNIAKTREDFKELLLEYASLSKGNLVYEFIDPNEDEAIESMANQSGISPVMINVREKDQMKQQKAYMGAIIEMGEQKDIIPFMQPGAAMEYALSSSIKKLAVVDKPAIGLVQGHGEPTTFEMQQVAEALNVMYTFENLTLTDSTTIPSRFKTIAIIAPKDTVPPFHLAQIDAFLNQGGHVLVALNRVDGNLQNAFGQSVYTGVENWLTTKGVTVENKFLIDASCGAVTVQQQQGPFRFANNIQFPYLPIINQFEEHPITEGLESVLLPFASPISFTGDTTTRFTPILLSSERSGTATVPTYFDIEKQWTEADFPLAEQVLGATLQGEKIGNGQGRMVVLGDGDFAINSREGQQPQAVQPDNASLFVNSIDWLSDDTGLISLRTKGVTSRPIDQLEDGTKFQLKMLNFGLPILLVIIYGIIRMQMKRNLRTKRMKENYA